jgi:multiple sugar transport system ATP-binding protein
MRAELQLLHRQLGVTTVCVSHDQMDAMTLGTRIAVMDRGKLRQIGPPKDVYAKPGDLFVAGFLGTPPINFLSATITAPERLTLMTGNGGTSYPIGNELASALGHREGGDAEVVLAIRPEKLRLGPAPSSGFGVQGRVYVVEAVGADQYAYVELGPDASVILRADPDLDLRVDEPVVISWDARDALIFDKSTTNRVWPK